MTVPETSVNKHNGGILRKDYVGFPGQAFSVQPESEAETMKQRAHPSFWRRIR
jgi:hypothetical protein